MMPLFFVARMQYLRLALPQNGVIPEEWRLFLLNLSAIELGM